MVEPPRQMHLIGSYSALLLLKILFLLKKCIAKLLKHDTSKDILILTLRKQNEEQDGTGKVITKNNAHASAS